MTNISNWGSEDRLRDELRDIHTEKAAEIFRVPEQEATPEMRRIAKRVNFGVLYGTSNKNAMSLPQFKPDRPYHRQPYLYKSVEIDCDYGEAELKFLRRYNRERWYRKLWLSVLRILKLKK